MNLALSEKGAYSKHLNGILSLRLADIATGAIDALLFVGNVLKISLLRISVTAPDSEVESRVSQDGSRLACSRRGGQRLILMERGEPVVLRCWPSPLAWERDPAAAGWRVAWPEHSVSRWWREAQLADRQRQHADWMARELSGIRLRGRTGLHAAVERAREEADRREVLRRALAPVPERVLRAIRRLRSGQWRLFAAAGRSNEFLELLETNPGLAFALAHHPELGSGRELRLQTVIDLARRRRSEIAGWLGFPESRSVARILGRVPRLSLSVELLVALREALRQTELARQLSHVPRINAGVVSLCADPDWLAAAAPSLLAEVGMRRRQDVDTPVVRHLRDALDMAEELRVRVPPGGVASVSQLSSWHDELVAMINRRKVLGVNRRFPAPPYAGTDSIVPIVDSWTLAEEGREQRNCVASYARRVLAGQVYVYRVLSPERATLALHPYRGTWILSELLASHNRTVGATTRQVVLDWLHSVSPVSELLGEPGPLAPPRARARLVRPQRRPRRHSDPRQLKLPFESCDEL